MQLNAIRALRRQRNCHRNQVLYTASMAPSFEGLLVKRPKGLHRLTNAFIQLVQLGEALHIKHADNSTSGMCVEDEMYGDFLWLQASRLQEGARIT